MATRWPQIQQVVTETTKQDTRLPPGYFAPSKIVKDAFSKDESTLILCFLIIFSNFSKFNFFPIFVLVNNRCEIWTDRKTVHDSIQ